jgi:hypothetical protein
MRNAIRILLCVAVVVGFAVVAEGQTAQQSAQRKLLALRAARVDAMRRLGERINGLTLTSETTVADFVTERDEIATELSASLLGARDVGDPLYNDDGTCEVTMVVTLQQVVADLSVIYRRYEDDSQFSLEDIQQIAVRNEFTDIEETGIGAPPPLPAEAEMVPVDSGNYSSARHLTGAAKVYWQSHCTAQGRLLATRAARVDGLRRLAERIGGVQIDADTYVRDFVTERDFVETAMGMFLQGARETGILYHPDELIVEVEMEVTLVNVLASVKSYMRNYEDNDRISIADIDNVIIRSEEITITETGMGVPRPEHCREVPDAGVAFLGLASNAPPWASTTFSMVGYGVLDPDNDNEAQARLMAFRAAELDARRKLAEEILGLVIVSETTVQDFVAERDDIRTGVAGLQQGVHVVEGSEQLAPDGTAEVTVEMDLSPLWEMILIYQRTYNLGLQ